MLLERIDNYCNNALSASERVDFENDLKNDPALAAEVAFYVQAKQVAQAEAHARRKAEWATLDKSLQKTTQRNIFYRYAAAASVVLLIGVGWLLFQSADQDNLPGQGNFDKNWAAAYVSKNFTTLNVQMSGSTDSLQMGISNYNSGDLEKAQTVFTQLLTRDSLNAEAQKYAGIVSLRQGHYDQAIRHFHRLGLRTDLAANPGKFYEALALLQRNLPLDKNTAENLLKEVKAAKLEGWKEVK